MDKETLRQMVQKRVASLSSAELAAADEAINRQILATPIWRQAQSVFCYLAVGREIATLPLLEAALAAGKQLAAPLITGPGLMDARLVSSLALLRPDRYGIPAPAQESPRLEPADIELVIVPGIAFARHTLLRLGCGGGYYDRWLAGCQGYRLAPAREAQIIDGPFPAQKHDLAMDLLVSEQGLYLPKRG